MIPKTRLTGVPCAVSSALLLAGCSIVSGPLVAPPLPSDPVKAADVIVYRDTAIVDAATRMVFMINGSNVYQLTPGEQYQFMLDPGTYEFGYRMGLDACSQTVLVAPGTHNKLRLGSDCVIELERQ